MKKTKRILSLLLSIGMLAALAACGTAPQEEEALPTQEPVETLPPAPTDAPSERVEELAAPIYPADRLFTEADKNGLNAFTAQTLPQIFAGLNGENRVYSPLNIYLALGMLAEISDGESRAQLLELLGEDGIESLRENARALFEASYCDDDRLTILPAASVWLREGEVYKPDALRQLAKNYYASAFSGRMGDERMNQALREWINERTNHLLEQQANGLSLNPETMIALVTTLYFKGGWENQFSDSETEKQPFHAESGDKEADFMRRSQTMDYYRGEHFGAICLPMMGGAEMWLLLPDEDSSLQALIDSGEAAALLAETWDWADKEEYIVHLALPKFDVDYDLSLIEALQALGVTDVFDAERADFTPLTDLPLFVSRVLHAARVKIDEEGCEAAAFTVIDVRAAGAPMPDPKEIDFVCDRPFLFAVTGQGGTLFVGAVNDPTK